MRYGSSSSARPARSGCVSASRPTAASTLARPAGGMVIFSNRARLIDGSLLSLPRTGVFTSKGVNMEKDLLGSLALDAVDG